MAIPSLTVMDRSMQERLAGTIVVVVLAIVLIPSWLDGPETPAARPRAADLPGATQSRIIRLDAEDRQPVASSPASVQPAAPATPAAPSAVEPEAETQDAAAPRTVAAPPPAEETPVLPAPGQPSAVGWAVQVGSFTNAAYAERLAGSLESNGFSAFVSRHEEGGRTLLRVRVGPATERPQAEALAARLEKAGHKTQIVRAP
ncbi:MAG: SPOR domain-containing protein [Gammaproteobacteria bacterium]